MYYQNDDYQEEPSISSDYGVENIADDAKKMGSASGHTITIRQLIPNAGAGFVVAAAGEIMRMPGLPKEPAAMGMDIQGDTIIGLS